MKYQVPSFEELREQALTAADKKSAFNWVRLLGARELDIIHMHLLPYLLSGLRQVLLPFFSGWGGLWRVRESGVPELMHPTSSNTIAIL